MGHLGADLHAACVLESQFKVFALRDAIVQLTDFATLGYESTVSVSITSTKGVETRTKVKLTSLLGDSDAEDAGTIPKRRPATLCEARKGELVRAAVGIVPNPQAAGIGAGGRRVGGTAINPSLGDRTITVPCVELLFGMNADLPIADIAADVLVVEAAVGADLALGEGAEGKGSKEHEGRVGEVHCGGGCRDWFTVLGSYLRMMNIVTLNELWFKEYLCLFEDLGSGQPRHTCQ